MRLSYQDLLQEHYRTINLVNSDGTPKTDVNVTNNFNYHLGQRYQLALAKMVDYKTELYNDSFQTVANQQYYSLPPGGIRFEGLFITVGSVNYPMQPITSLFEWQKLNSIMIQASALPQFYFPRRDDFGIWPIPQAIYTGKASYYYRDRNLSVPDYTQGTITLTAGSNAFVGNGTAFTQAMVGRWVTVTDNTVPGQGYFYRVINITDGNHGTMNTDWDAISGAGVAYRICETPELPEEMHQILSFGTAADYYGTMQKDKDAFAWNNNMFYTGDPTNTSRDFQDRKIGGGLIGGVNSYTNRDDRTVIRRRPKLNPLQYKVFATTLS